MNNWRHVCEHFVYMVWNKRYSDLIKSLHLAFNFLAVASESLEAGMWTFYVDGLYLQCLKWYVCKSYSSL